MKGEYSIWSALINAQLARAEILHGALGQAEIIHLACSDSARMSSTAEAHMHTRHNRERCLRSDENAVERAK